MKVRSDRLTRALGAALVLLLAGCATPLDTATRSPPRVDVPEPGAARAAGRPAVAAPVRPAPPRAGNASVHPAPGATTYPAAEAGSPQVIATPAAPVDSAYPQAGELPPAEHGSPGPGVVTPPADENAFTIEMPAAAAPPPAAVAEGLAPPPSSNRAVTILLAQADSARRDGNLDSAIAAAERAVRIAPSDPAAYCQLAELRLARGERAQAEQLARKGLSNGPGPELRARLEAVAESSRR
ncbi:MAG: tetratricopeptide repeat protein [Pseudomonadales bacterium]|jgi:hypothetical protein|nr:tetratricopeptide repeat protein [Pseudomonadales bacterium]MCP5321954.1 tetratricopeptide repeat protein [Pseudomonadales bacterium]